MIKPDTIKVLLVDDDEDDVFLTSDYLNDIQGQNFVIDWAKSFEEAINRIKTSAYDICFFDFLLGAKTGLDLLKLAIEQGLQTPIVLLTGKGDQKIDIEAMRLGAADYLVKSALDSEKLERCIRYTIERATIINVLRESERKYRNILHQSTEAFFLVKLDGNFIYFNSAMCLLLGYTKDELTEMNINALFDKKEDCIRFGELLEKHGEINNFEVFLIMQSGEKKQCSIHANRQVDSDGNPYYVGIILDITAQKKAEREALLSEKMAATGRLVRTLAHEVRNPLTNINLSVEQLKSDFNDEEAIFFLDIIRRNSQRINDLISELLNSSRPAEVVFSRLSIQQVLEDTISQAIDRINLKNIKLEKYFGQDCQLHLDQSKIKIAFLNIIINAVEAMREGEGVLKISTSKTDKYYNISIADNGEGISPENIRHLFEPYFTSKNNGIGLGLASTLNILQSHKASIEVQSELGKGSVFKISFPV